MSDGAKLKALLAHGADVNAPDREGRKESGGKAPNPSTKSTYHRLRQEAKGCKMKGSLSYPMTGLRIAGVMVGAALVVGGSLPVIAEYKDTPHRALAPGEIAVTGPGSYAGEGKTYVLTRDVSSDRTAIFLGQDVTLDLNGYTVTFAQGAYEHILNYGFEAGLKGWDVSQAPGAKVVSSTVAPMVGERILELKAGDEIVSQYITLPVADRTYYAMCAVATNQQEVTINVDDGPGNPVTCEFKGGAENRVGPPFTSAPELGGGVLFAHLHHLPAGKYRIRIKAETDALIDECDIRPGLDAGIAIVGSIKPYATYSDALKWFPCSFFDYNQKDAAAGVPMEGIPLVVGAGTVTIKDGIVRNGTLGMRTLGVQSNANDVNVVLRNVKIVNAGINTNAVRLLKGTLRDCRFEVDTPFIIDRHNTTEMSVQVAHATEIAHCEFIGGQGNFSGGCPDIHDNLFVNAQTVTNHYSISPRTGTRVYRNRFEPKIGSGIYIGGGHDVEVFENVFRIESAPPNCEYRYQAYSTNAVRLSDYDTPPTGPAERRCTGNRVYNNRIFITGRSYPQYDRYEPRAYAFFISVGGGTNFVYDNEIVVRKRDRGNVRAYAFFVGGSSNGGEIYDNRVTSNGPVAWIGNDYGKGENTLFYGNTFIRGPGAPADVRPFILGDGGNSVQDLGFFSNVLRGWTDPFQYHSNSITYEWGWTLTVKVADRTGKPQAGAGVVVTNKDGDEVFKGTTDDRGVAVARLAQFQYAGGEKTDCGAYTVKSGAAEAKVDMTQDATVTLRVE